MMVPSGLITGELFGDGEAEVDVDGEGEAVRVDVKVLAASTYSDSSPSSLDAKVSSVILCGDTSTFCNSICSCLDI